jgi:hypothetical protein
VASDTSVTLMLDSAALFTALQAEVGAWRLQDHEFDPQSDELRMVYDRGGTGRVALTVAFELDREQVARLLDAARAAS